MTSTQGSPISLLNDDILLNIFSMNTDISQGGPDRKGTTCYDDLCLTEANPDPEGRGCPDRSLANLTKLLALTITLRTSQVCRRWRDLLITSSSIWGRLLDLNILSRANDLLRQEIYRRAGHGSRLSVKGYMIPFPSPVCDFIFNLIETQWERLEWVDIYLKTSVNLSVQESQFWNAITAPAPNLRHFAFGFSKPIPNTQFLTAAAPALRELCVCPSSPLDFNSPWLHQLTYLSIDGVGETASPYTFPAFLDALSSLKHLEVLRLLDTGIAEGCFDTHQSVQLPSLQQVLFWDNFTTCFVVLRHISPPQQCTIEICAESPHDLSNDPYRELAVWLERYLKGRTYNDRILIDLQPTYASFEDAYPNCYPAPTMKLRFRYTSPNNGLDALSFFRHLPRSKFGQVKDLWFRVNLPNLHEEIDDFLPVSDDFHFNLKSLEVLKTSVQGFFLFAMASDSIDEDDKIPIPLPRLRRV